MTEAAITAVLRTQTIGANIRIVWRYVGLKDEATWYGHIFERKGGVWPRQFEFIDASDNHRTIVGSQIPRPFKYGGHNVEILEVIPVPKVPSEHRVRLPPPPKREEATTARTTSPKREEATTARTTSPEALDPTSRGESRPSTRVYRATTSPENPKERALPDIPFDTGSLQRLISAHANGAPIHLWRHVHNTTSAEKLEGTIVPHHSFL